MIIREFSASVLAAEPLRLHDQISQVIELNIQSLHLDIMDCHYVDNIALSFDTVSALVDQFPSLQCDVHLMVSSPEAAIKKLPLTKLRMVTFHPETSNHPEKLIQEIQEKCGASIAINPDEDAKHALDLIALVDHCLIMGVTPGRCGQPFQENALVNLETVHSAIKTQQLTCKLGIDGGVNSASIPEIVKRKIPIDVAVMGSALFNNLNSPEKTSKLLATAQPQELLIT